MMPMPWLNPYPDRVPSPRFPGSGRTRQRLRRSRMFGWDGNPVRRRTDRVEAALIAALIALFLAAAPLVAAVAGRWSESAGLREQLAEASWRQVPAILEHGGGSPPGDYFAAPAGKVWMQAHWTAPDGQPGRGWALASPQAPAGSSMRIWVTRSGLPAGPPLQRSQLRGRTELAGVLAPAVLAFLLFFAGGAGRYLLGRRRAARWDQAWQAVGSR